jgi:DNA-binding response OmpR family regulator
METYRILVIEDDPAIGLSLLDGFKQHGFHANLCKTGSSGINLAIVKMIVAKYGGNVTIQS